jgi:glycosyltransferase involved in cell wall biosynthesis
MALHYASTHTGMSIDTYTPRYEAPLLTIVVAAYNVEGYIEEALASVLRQPYGDAIRLVVVDDGSTDDTYAAVQAAMKRDGRKHVELIRQENAGVSAARNRGLAAVNTPYVGFLDGDDIYLDGFSAAVVPQLADLAWDIVEYNVTIIDDDGRRLEDLEIVPAGNEGGKRMDDAGRRQFVDLFHTFVWARVFRTSLFGIASFPVARHYEDMAVMPSIYMRAHSVFRIGTPLLGYRRRFGSITQRASLRDLRDLRTNGLEALAQCSHSEAADFWLRVFNNNFERACHVGARVDRGSFREALDILFAMAADRREAYSDQGQATPRHNAELGRLHLKVGMDRLVHLLKRMVKKALRRRLDRQARPRRQSSY